MQSTKKTDKKLCNAMEVDEEVDEDGDNAMEGNASGIRNSLTTVMPSIFLKKRHDKSFKELQKKIAPRQVVQPRKQPRKTSRLQPLRPMGVAERREKMKKSMMVHQKPGYCENCNVKYESFSDVRVPYSLLSAIVHKLTAPLPFGVTSISMAGSIATTQPTKRIF